MATGEDVLRGLSLQARLVVLPVSTGDIGHLTNGHNAPLGRCQQDAEGGFYAASLAGFVSWVAPQLLEFQSRLVKEQNELSHHDRKQKRADPSFPYHRHAIGKKVTQPAKNSQTAPQNFR